MVNLSTGRILLTYLVKNDGYGDLQCFPAILESMSNPLIFYEK